MKATAPPAAEAQSPRTRQRLLEAAGEIFAERGFREATVREIVKRAGANIASVNYHFGDKERFYSAVVAYAHGCAVEKYPSDPGLGKEAAPADRLRAFVHSFLSRILDEGRPAWHGKLMSREMADPTRALDRLVEESIRPQYLHLASIVRALLGRRATEERVRLCALSIVGQCLFYHHARAVVTRLHPQVKYGPAAVGRLADHIASFSLAALRGSAKGAGP
jgi:AcrR family transcriptional regulator